MDAAAPPPTAPPPAAPPPAASPPAALPAALLYLNVFIVATCGLVYELVAGTLGSYLLGDSVRQFSLVIGLYLSAMGVGAWLSKFLDGDLARRFIDVELLVALTGGLSAPVLFVAFGQVTHFQVLLLATVLLIGTLVGLEIPLLMRLLERQVTFKDLVSRVLTFDYLGALLAALAFPLLLVPSLGLVRTSLAMGLVNALVGLWGTWLLAPVLRGSVVALRVRAVAVCAVLAVGIASADRLTSWSEDQMYADEIVYGETSSYQRIVVTRSRAGFNLFLNGNLQFAAADEYRYHEALVHPAMAAAAAAGAPPRRVLVLGGGDGLALREVLAHPQVEAVTLVDLDPAMTRLARRFEPLAELNRRSLDDPRVTVVNDDAFVWVATDAAAVPGGWDAVIVDFPDPNSFSLGKLYTTRFYRLLRSRLAPHAAVAVQATSPLFARRAYWCIVETMREAGFHVAPYQVTVPSFGVWGFALAQRAPFSPPSRAPAVPLRYLTDDALRAMFVFPADMAPLPVEVNRLDNQRLVAYYEGEWRRWQ